MFVCVTMTPFIIHFRIELDLFANVVYCKSIPGIKTRSVMYCTCCTHTMCRSMIISLSLFVHACLVLYFVLKNNSLAPEAIFV